MERIGIFTYGKFGMAGVVLTKYDDGNLAVLLEDSETEEPLCKLSVNIPEHASILGPTQFFAKTYSENAPFREPALKSGLFTDTGVRIKQGYVEIEVWQVNRDKQLTH